MDSSSSYHTCVSVDITKISPPLENQPVQKRVEFADNNNASKMFCNVSIHLSFIRIRKIQIK